ncbi:class I SAM-dependent methyltransferase [Frateuria sp. GZRe12]|uniref:class I SAM-dependent methyltransferase n=1 Tax=Frateuria sp. GZRe12 TaxID=3351533 RepID=UPI003EDC2D96
MERSIDRKADDRGNETRDYWNLVDPCSPARFVRKEPVISEDASNETVLKNVVLLADHIFDHLSVFEQFSEASSRGAPTTSGRKVQLPEVRAQLAQAREHLWRAFSLLRTKQEQFVNQQLDALGINADTRGIKVHIGSSGNLLEEWLNIDAGGADLALNVNWGLHLPDESAKFVYCAHLLEHLRYGDQAPLFLREIHRILETGGVARLVVPDVGKLLRAYANQDREFFLDRRKFYPMYKGFVSDGLINLDYILLFCGANKQVLSYNHKFGYDFPTLSKLLYDAGFSRVSECSFQGSTHEDLRVDGHSYNAMAKTGSEQSFSLFVEATK